MAGIKCLYIYYLVNHQLDLLAIHIQMGFCPPYQCDSKADVTRNHFYVLKPPESYLIDHFVSSNFVIDQKEECIKMIHREEIAI